MHTILHAIIQCRSVEHPKRKKSLCAKLMSGGRDGNRNLASPVELSFLEPFVPRTHQLESTAVLRN